MRSFVIETARLTLCAAQGNTFGIQGVDEFAHPLRTLSDARAIREHVLECLERAAAPSIASDEKRRLLTFVCVGGGPTAIEVCQIFNLN